MNTIPRRRRSVWVGALAGLALLLASCGTNDDADATPADPPADEVDAVEPDTVEPAPVGDTDADPIGYWWELEAAGEAPFLRLAQVFATTPAIDDSGEPAVFPRVATGRAQDTTDDARAELHWIEDRDEVAGTGEGYLGWRVAIALDGQWRFFVAGD